MGSTGDSAPGGKPVDVKLTITMPHFYADTSVLVKNYVTELGSTWARQWVASESNVIYIGDYTHMDQPETTQ